MRPKTPDIAHPPTDPQYTLGATSDEAAMKNQIANSSLPEPGDIVKRLGYQFELPRAEPDASISRDTHGLPNG